MIGSGANYNGFVGGHVDAIAFATDSTTGSTAAYIGGSTGGIWRSDNFTDRYPDWKPLTDGLTVNSTTGAGIGQLAIGALAVNLDNSKMILAGTGTNEENIPGAGILMTLDGGTSRSHRTFRHRPVDFPVNLVTISASSSLSRVPTNPSQRAMP